MLVEEEQVVNANETMEEGQENLDAAPEINDEQAVESNAADIAQDGEDQVAENSDEEESAHENLDDELSGQPEEKESGGEDKKGFFRKNKK